MFDKFFGFSFYRKYRELLLLILDLAIVVFSYGFAWWIKHDFTSLASIKPNFEYMVFLMSMILVIYAFSFYVFKVYKSLWKYINTTETFNLAKANCLAMFLTVFISRIMGQEKNIISFEISAGILALLLMYFTRTIYRTYRSYGSRKLSESGDNTIIIGAGDGGNLLMKELMQNSKLHYNVVGFIDDTKKDIFISGKPILGTLSELHEIVINHEIKVALLAIPSASKDDVLRITELCTKEKLNVKIMNMLSAFDDTTFNRALPVQEVQIEDLLGRGEVKLEQDEISSYLKGTVVCVTGAAGSIGSELCRKIVAFHPKKIIMVDVNENALYMFEQECNRNHESGYLSRECEIITLIASIREKDAISNILKKYKVEVVFHAAAHKHVPLMESRPNEAIKNNVFGTHNVITSCIEQKVKRFIMISTDKAVNPTNVMGATKRMTEMLLQAYGKDSKTKMAAVRFGNVLGSNGSVIPIFKEQIKAGGPLTITDKKMTRYFMTISEAAQLVLQAGYYADKGELFVLDMGTPVKILDLAENMIRLSGLKPYKDIEIKEIGLRPGEKMYEEINLGCETPTRTKNDLIFKIETEQLSMNQVNKAMDKLVEIASENDDLSIVKDTLFNIIR